MVNPLRIRAASKAALFHFLGSLLLASAVGAFVFLIWYPHPYELLSGGRNLFLILITVDAVCGPLLTLVLFSPQKPRRELVVDMGLVILIQLAALAYGMHTAYQARPLFLVHEVDRFRVISLTDFNGEDVSHAMETLDPQLRPRWYTGPVVVGIREPKSSDERKEVLFDSVMGGRDYSQRPEFYVPYDASYRPRVMGRVKPLRAFTEHFPDAASAAAALVAKSGVTSEDVVFVPVLHKQDWVAVLDQSAHILGYLPGDGFAVP